LTKKDLQDIEALIKTHFLPVNTRLDDLEHMQKALSADVAKFNHTIVPTVDLILEYVKSIMDNEKRIDKAEAVQ